MKKVIILLMFYFGVSEIASGQNFFDSSAVYNAIIKNMIAYEINEGLIKKQESVKAYGYASYFSSLDNPLPDDGLSYKLILKKTNLVIDSFDYDIYEYNVVNLDNTSFDSKCLKDSILILSRNAIIKNRLCYSGLIAVTKHGNVTASTMLFISGQIFVDEIKKIVIKKRDKESLNNYTLLRFYNYGPEVESINLKKGEVVFYSSILKNKYKLLIGNVSNQLIRL